MNQTGAIMAEDNVEKMRSLKASDQPHDEEEVSSEDISKVMGFGHFGGEKQAKKFDFMTMFEESRKTAMERSQPVLTAREEEHKRVLQEQALEIESGLSSKGGFKSSFEPEKTTKSTTGGFKSSFKPAFKPAFSEEKKATTTAATSATTARKAAEDSDSEDDVVGPPLPPGFKRPSQEKESDEEIGPPIPPDLAKPTDADNKTRRSHREEGSSDEEDDDDDDNPVKKIPSNHEIVLNHGDKIVSALALDPAGARLVSGSYDYEVKFWDFAGMDVGMRSFRSIRPCECHPIKAVEYSCSGDNILVVAGNAQAKVIDRDGFEVLECIKGDQYITDQARTKGHTAMLNNGCWHPKSREEFMTCSMDGTLRLWDINEDKKHKNCIKPRSKSGRKSTPTTCAYSRDGRWVAGGCLDGSIQIWDHNKNYVNIAMKNMDAHQPGTDISCLNFSYDGNVLASRGGDDTVKLWDFRNFKKPLCVAENLPNFYPVTDCTFSPDDKLLMTGLSTKRGEGTGRLVFLDRTNLEQVGMIDVVEGESVIRSLWHPKLNQICVGLADGKVKVFYDPDKSHRGAMLCAVKQRKKARDSHMMVATNVITPHALPIFRQSKPTSTRKADEKARKDPIVSHRPDLPVTGPGKEGRVGAKGATLSQYVLQQLVVLNPDDRDKDPRAAILRHAEEAEKNPYWVDPAYKKTQPVKIFHESSSDSDEDNKNEPLWKKQKI